MGSTAVIDQSMAAALDPGSVASLSYGQKLVSVLLGLSSGAMGTVVLPHFSGLAARGDWHALQGMLRSSLRWIALTATPVTVVLVWQSVAITHLMFQRNAFTPETAVTVGEIQALYAIQVPFYLMSILAARVISSMRANHLLMWGAGISLVVDITLNYVFMQWIGVKGIALSTTMVLASSFVFLWIVMSRRLRRVMATDRERLAAGKTLQQGDASRPF